MDRDNNNTDDYFIKILNEYKEMSKADLKQIKPIWKNELTPDSYKIIKTGNLLKVIETVYGLNVNNVLDNKVLNTRRVLNFLRMWRNGLPAPLPIYDAKNEIIIDGRHRILASHFLGATTIPIKYK